MSRQLDRSQLNGSHGARTHANGDSPAAPPPRAADGPKVCPWPSVTAAQLKSKRVEWLWQDHLAVGKVTLLTGEQGACKSTLADTIAAAVSDGRALPGGPKLTPGDVAILTAEADPDTDHKPRLRAAGAKMRRVHFPGWNVDGDAGPRPSLPSQVDELAAYLIERKVRLLIIDPIDDFLDPEYAEDSGRTARAIMLALTNLARKVGCAILVIKHPRKGRVGSATDQVSGSKHWLNAPRLALVMGKVADNDKRRVLAVLKPYGGPPPASLAWTITGPKGRGRLVFAGESTLSAQDLFSGETDPVELTKREHARQIIRDLLDDDDVPAKDVLRILHDSGIGESTANAAKKDLRVESYVEGTHPKRYWVWKKPEQGWPE